MFGAWGEASPDTERLLTVLARAGAARHWLQLRARSPVEARGALAWLLRRRWGMTALREKARVKLERLEFVGRGAALAADRRAAALTTTSAVTRRAVRRFWAGAATPHWSAW